MRLLAAIGAFVILAGPAPAGDSPRLLTFAPREVPGAILELRGWDPAGSTVTLVGEAGREQVLRVDDRTLLAVSRLAPGDKLLVSYRFNQRGETEVILREIPLGEVAASRAPVSRIRMESASRVVVLSADATAETLTIRGDRGDVRTVSVQSGVADALRDLRPGDHVLVDVEAGRVVAIERSR